MPREETVRGKRERTTDNQYDQHKRLTDVIVTKLVRDDNQINAAVPRSFGGI